MPSPATRRAGRERSISWRRSSRRRTRMEERMTAADDLAANVRAVLAGMATVREVRMFGGIGFMLNGNMIAAASKRGLLVRIGKARQPDALLRPGARPMEMRG